MKKIMYNKHIVRILSSFMLCVLVLSSALPVYASSDDTVSESNLDDLISKYSDQIKEQTITFWDTVKVNVSNIGSIWSGFVSFWKITVGTGAYGWSTTQLVANLSKDFITYLRNNYLWGYTEDGNQNFYIDEDSHGGGARDDTKVNNKLPEFVPGENTYPNNSYKDYMYYIGYSGNFPYNFGDSFSEQLQNSVVFSQNPYNKYPAEYPPQGTSGIVKGYLSNSPSQVSGGWGVYYGISQQYTTIDNSIIINSFDSQPFLGSWYIDNNRLYFQKASTFPNKSYRQYVQNINYSNYAPLGDIYVSGGYQINNITKPFYFYGSEFIVNCFGNHFFEVNNHKILYYLGNFYDVTNTYTDHGSGLYSVDLTGFITFNVTNIDNGITNFNNTVNNFVNNYNFSPDYLLYVLNDYLNQINIGSNYDEYFEDINIRLEDLYAQFLEMQEELQDMSGTLVKIKNFCKNIDTTLTELFNRIDSLFTNTGAFSIAVQLDRLFHHLEETINSLPIPSSSGSGDVNFNFGDLDLHLEATLNSFFTMNEEQKNEIAADVQTLKSPFNWVGDVTKNMKSLAGKMVARSAAYAGVGYNENAFSQDSDSFDNLDFTVSQNGASSGSTYSGQNNNINNNPDSVEEDIDEETVYEEASSGESVNDNNINNGGLEPPKIMIHFGNATSEINYGGDAVALDFSWYAPYKPYVDKFIVAFCWAVFLWHLVRSIPGIIGGVDGYVSDISGTITAENIDRRHAKTDAAYSKIGRFHRFRGR